MKDFEKGAKRKCPACSTLFFDFNNSPIICPNCGTEVTSLLTNVSKRGRPPKNAKPDTPVPENAAEEDVKIEEIPVEDTEIADIENDEPVEEIVEVPKEED
ncbi:MAG: hypothetical protein CMM99_00905 [Rickettsiales bacterium]|nr:hypothetical protein [Rickettsiales bacterium]|tara:strand:- start:143 stop:445 length:303 start_codon:yes stop_codon:yes gene_type:complete